jgi:NAD(P)-dependent dehydrogenase (short-subunit alcohol dehydrogenase family)
MELQGRTALVTGSTDGVGRLVALDLARRGMRVIIHGRTPEKVERVLRELREAAGPVARLGGQAADLASLAAVRRLAAEVATATDQLDLLINNAGIGFGRDRSRREESADGIELRFAVNYLAGYLLTHLLLPIVSREGGRIVNVSSIGQHPIDFADPDLAHGYEGTRAYRQSKLAQIMLTIDLAEALAGSGITAICLHPATLMNTTMVAESGMAPLSRVEEGVAAVLHAATSGSLAGRSGIYLDGTRESRANPQAYDAEARRQLRELSRRLTGME